MVGGAGFLGSHLVNHLVEDRDCNVVVIDNLVSGRREFIHRGATFEHADITGSEQYLLKLFRHYKTQFVFNYAAEPYIPKSFERPVHVFATNAFGALKVINAAQEANCEAILQVSSAEIYGDQEGKITESAPVTPHSSYGASKAAIDAMVQVRYREARTPVMALRQFNCFGERETHPYVIPEIISQLSQQTDYSVATIELGNNSTRDFQYAGDAVRIATRLLEEGVFGKVYNMGSETTIKIYELAHFIGALMGFRAVVINKTESRIRPWEIWHLQSDNSKLNGVVGNYSTTEWETALQRTIDHFRSNGNKWIWQ